MSDRSEILDLITAVLDAKDGKKPKRAPKAPSTGGEINGIRIVDEPKRAPGRPKKPVHVADRSASPTPAPRARASRQRSPSPEAPPRGFPKPSGALALKRSAARPMPHSCNCALCPLKKD